MRGQFMIDDAEEILMDIFSAELKFYQLKSFSSEERLGKRDESAEKRVNELRQRIGKLRKLIDELKSKNARLTISSNVEISLPASKKPASR
jgi:hypothetical protein